MRYEVTGESLTSVADAIRERAGTTEPLAFPEEYESVVRGIPHYDDAILERTIKGEYRNERIAKLGASCFANCGDLWVVICPSVTTVSAYAFQNCWSVWLLDCGATKIESAFPNAISLKALILRGDSIATLDSASVLSSTKIASGTGYVYVKRKLLSDTDSTKDYRIATNWANYSTQFKILEDFTVDGTATGDVVIWQSGLPLSNGTIADNTAFINTNNFVPNTVKKVSVNIGYEMLITCYQDDGSNLSPAYWTDNGVNGDGQWYTSIDLDAVFSQYKNIRLCLRRTDRATMDVDEGRNVIYTLRTEV